MRLTEIVRASTAAPTYFEPERFAISSRDGAVVDAAFVDGASQSVQRSGPATPLMLAALQGHGFRWRTGKDQVLLISVGTGSITDTPNGCRRYSRSRRPSRA